MAVFQQVPKMTCLRILIVGLIVSGGATSVQAQVYHHIQIQGPYPGEYWPMQPPIGTWGMRRWSGDPYMSPPVAYSPVAYPPVAFNGYPGQYPYATQSPIFVRTGPDWFSPTPGQPSPFFVPTVSVMPIPHPAPLISDVVPDTPPVKTSTLAGRLKSLDYQAHGDEQLRKQLWAQAYMRYRSAINAAGDRGEARFRQGFTYTAMQHYSSAVREFKRGLVLDPELPASGIKLSMLFGPGSETVRTSILHKAADWVREEPRDADRWFLLGLMLHYEDDPRAVDALQAARQLAAGADGHILGLLAVASENQPDAAGAESSPALLSELPALPQADPLAADDRIPQLNPVAESPFRPGLPPFRNQAAPPRIFPVRP